MSASTILALAAGLPTTDVEAHEHLCTSVATLGAWPSVARALGDAVCGIFDLYRGRGMSVSDAILATSERVLAHIAKRNP